MHFLFTAVVYRIAVKAKKHNVVHTAYNHIKSQPRGYKYMVSMSHIRFKLI